MERIGRVVAADADFILGFFVKRLQVVVGDWPVFERASRRRAIGGAHLEVLRHKTPGLRSPTERSAAHAGGDVLVLSAVAGKYSLRYAVGADPNARMALVFRSKRTAQYGVTLIAQVVLAVIVGGVPLAALQQDYAQSGGREFLGDHAAAGARSHNHSIHSFHECVPFFRSYCARPRSSGSSRPSIRQLTALRLPPWRGEP